MSRSFARFDPKAADARIWRTTENGKHFEVETETGEITKGNIGQGEWDSPSAQASRRAKVEDAMREIANGRPEATVRGLRNDLEQYGGSNDVTLIRGDEKKGLVHIERRHGSACVAPVLEAVANGKIARFSRIKKTVALQKDGYEAILSLEEHRKKKTWLLTGYDIREDMEKEPTGDSGKFCTRHAATHDGPTFGRPDMGAMDSEKTLTGDSGKVSARHAATQAGPILSRPDMGAVSSFTYRIGQLLEKSNLCGPFTGPFAGLNRISVDGEGRSWA